MCEEELALCVLCLMLIQTTGHYWIEEGDLELGCLLSETNITYENQISNLLIFPRITGSTCNSLKKFFLT